MHTQEHKPACVSVLIKRTGCLRESPDNELEGQKTMDTEKLRLKGQDLGLSTLQKQTQAGRQTQTERKIRKWKTVKVRSPQGLGEIEQLDREEGSNKVMQALELFMRAHPTQWNESAVQLFLAEIAGTQTSSPRRDRVIAEPHECVQSVITRLLAPMVEILDVQQESIKKERRLAEEKHQQDMVELQKLQEERDRALVQVEQETERVARQNILCNSILQDLEEMGKKIEESREAALEADLRLAEKEKEVDIMLYEQQQLIIRLVCGGPATFVEWAREETQKQGHDLIEELEQVWWASCPDLVEDKLPLRVDTISFKSPESSYGPGEIIKQVGVTNQEAIPTKSMSEMEKLLWSVVSEVSQQVVVSYNRVAEKGPFALPSALIGFWFALSGRMIYLGAATILSKLTKSDVAITS